MDDQNVLSPEEVEALINATSLRDAHEIPIESTHEQESSINTHTLSNILIELAAELEKKLTVLFRKKVLVKPNALEQTTYDEVNKVVSEHVLYVGYSIPSISSSMFIKAEDTFCEYAIGLMYGGNSQINDKQHYPPGKVGNIVITKIAHILSDAFKEELKQHGEFEHIHHKTCNTLSNACELYSEDILLPSEFIITIEEMETKLILFLTEDLLIKYIPVKSSSTRHREKDFWRTAIKSEVIDSYVNISATIADVKMKYKDFIKLKEGDEIPISEPTLAYICLNKLKLFRAVAAQSNSKVVVKIITQV